MLSNSTIGGLVPFGDHNTLESAAFLVDKAMQSDMAYLDLSELLQVPKHTVPNVSGRMDFDYPSLGDPKIGLAALREVGGVKKIPLPEELTEQYARMQCNCLMGVFPEISRAWLTIDSDIFVWNYEDGTDLAYFDGLGESILSVALLTPKAGIFQPHIQYLLCLSTPVDIVLLGVSFAKPQQGYATNHGEMHLLPEPLFSLPTDSVHMKCIVSTELGRVFMAGKDGCLYELVYQAEEGWFSRKCRKVNHSTSKLSYVIPSFLNFSFVEDDALVQLVVDDTRNVLYARSEKGTIQVYDLGYDGLGLGKVAAISHQTTVQNATLLAKSIDKSSFTPLVSIHAITKAESSNVHLVAVTQSGIRLYFTTNPFSDNRGRPGMLSMIHVRLPPGFSMSSSVQKPSNITKAHYSRGTLLLASKQSEDTELLWVISSDSFPFQKVLRETYENLGLTGNTWALAEIPSGDIPRDMGRPRPPAVVTQHMEGDRRFVLLNPNESYVLHKMSPVEQLRHMLERHGSESDDVMALFQLHKEQACATCLVLACSQQAVQRTVAELATRAFFLHGGDPEYNYNPGIATTLGPGLGGSYLSSPSAVAAPGQFSTPTPGLQPNQMSTSYQQATNHGALSSPEVIHSARHNGICLYLARILRPLWDRRIVNEFTAPKGQQKYLVSAFSTEELSFVLNRLLDLRDFMAKHSQYASPLLAESLVASQNMAGRSSMGGRVDIADEQTRRKCQAEAESQEAASLRHLQELMSRVCEALGLWSILSEHQFHVVVASLSADQQNTLRNMAFRNLATSGKEVSSFLITALISMYIDDNAATDAISERLREVCPALYSVEDALCSKGNEKLQTARTLQSSGDKGRQLEEALTLYKQITAQLDLPVVCNQFGQARFYRGIVDLSLTAASKRDAQGLALHFYKNGQPPDDTQGSFFYNARMDCYKCITETLDYLLSTSMAHPQAPSVPKSPGPPPPQDPNRLTNTEADRCAEEVFSLALQSRDEMFHIALYDWLVGKKLPEKLLEIQSPFLEPYLKQAATQYPDQLATLDLLWKYYEKSKNYAAAARILSKLADRCGTDLTLTQRMEYLSRAAICAKSSTLSTSGGQEGEFLHELEEKLEVARLQLQILDALPRHHGSSHDVQDAVARLNSELMDITALYGDFADRFGLAECKLAIIHCAGHHDPTLIETLWQDIIDKELQTVSDRRAVVRTLSNKLVTLGRMYGTSDRYFPIAFLIKYLEQRSCEYGLDHVDLTFVVTTLQQVGVTLPRLHELYDRLHASKDSCWKSLRKPYHVLFVIQRLLDGFATKPATVPAYERRHFATVSLDAVARCLVELQADGATSDSVRQLIGSFKDLQAKLERL